MAYMICYHRHMSTITPGVYVHYKSDDMRYEVVGVGMHSETQEEVVIYKPLYTSPELNPEYWVRPYAMFVGSVEVDGQMVPRFRRVDE